MTEISQQTIDALMKELSGYSIRAYLMNFIGRSSRGEKWEYRGGSSLSVQSYIQTFERLGLVEFETVTTGKKRIKTTRYMLPTATALALLPALRAWSAEVDEERDAETKKRHERENRMIAGPHFYDAVKPIMDRVKIGEPVLLTIDEINALNAAVAIADGKISVAGREDLPV